MKKVGLRRLVLRYQGLFDFEGLYAHIVKFFISRNYEYEEKRWKEKEFSPLGRERVIRMAPWKRISEYIKHEYAIEWNNMDVHTVDVVRNGKTVTLTWARFEFICHASLVIDWQKLGKANPKTAKFFNEKVINREISEVYAADLILEEQRLVDEMKQFLHMEVTRLSK